MLILSPDNNTPFVFNAPVQGRDIRATRPMPRSRPPPQLSSEAAQALRSAHTRAFGLGLDVASTCRCPPSSLGQPTDGATIPRQCPPMEWGMPCRSNTGAPAFNGDAITLYKFFETFEALANARRVPDAMRNACLLSYVASATRFSWEHLLNTSGTYEALKTEICVFYLGQSTPRKYRTRQLEALVEEYARSTKEYSETYLDAFIDVAGWLYQNRDLDEREVGQYFWVGIHGLSEGQRRRAVDEARRRTANVFSTSWLDGFIPGLTQWSL